MILYKCPRCGYATNRKSNITNHLNRKNLCPPTLSNILPKLYEKNIFENGKVGKKVFRNILSFEDSVLDFLKNKDYAYCINRIIFCIPNLVKKIHFDTEHPENHNIYLPNIRKKYINVYENGNWTIKSLTDMLDKIILDYEIILEEWLESKGTNSLIANFEKYLSMKKDPKITKTIREEIKLLLYNNRNIVKN